MDRIRMGRSSRHHLSDVLIGSVVGVAAGVFIRRLPFRTIDAVPWVLQAAVADGPAPA
jgi:membrane-associated phospholipid phosphatase